jgi:Na+-transporting methylmalonyl-CoA/oxaloacetate decarboxylase gamma subunit
MDDLLFGLRTAVLGMAFVFAILAIVWGLLTVLASADARLDRRAAAAAASGGAAAGAAAGGAAAAEDTAQPPPATRGPAGITGPAGVKGPAGMTGPAVSLIGAPADADPRLIAAVTIAVLRHEEARRLQAAPAMRSYWPGSLLFASRWVSAGRTRQGQSWRRRR